MGFDQLDNGCEQIKNISLKFGERTYVVAKIKNTAHIYRKKR